MTTEDKSQIPLFSPEDEKETQKAPDHHSTNGTLKETNKWTGFQGKTMWDWLQLLGVLAIPLVVAGATLLFGLQQANLANQQHENDQKIANQQRAQDQQSALDQQRQAVLVKYQDDMRDLLLNKGLLTSKPGDEIREIALTETLSAMRQLDGKRNSFLIRFLEDAHLNGAKYNIVNFYNADLSDSNFTEGDISGVNLSGAYLYGAHLTSSILRGADLSGAVLRGADLRGAYLITANLSGAVLYDADLRGAVLSDAILRGADLSGAVLRGAHFSGAVLSDANLYDADLRGADLTQQQLDQVLTCKGAILPSGLTCHHKQ